MDTFMDRLAQRLNAQEAIKANKQAEEREASEFAAGAEDNASTQSLEHAATPNYTQSQETGYAPQSAGYNQSQNGNYAGTGAGYGTQNAGYSQPQNGGYAQSAPMQNAQPPYQPQPQQMQQPGYVPQNMPTQNGYGQTAPQGYAQNSSAYGSGMPEYTTGYVKNQAPVYAQPQQTGIAVADCQGVLTQMEAACSQNVQTAGRMEQLQNQLDQLVEEMVSVPSQIQSRINMLNPSTGYEENAEMIASAVQNSMDPQRIADAVEDRISPAVIAASLRDQLRLDDLTEKLMHNPDASDMERILVATQDRMVNLEQLRLELEECRHLIQEYSHQENVKVYRNVQASVAEELDKRSDSQKKLMDDLNAQLARIMTLETESKEKMQVIMNDLMVLRQSELDKSSKPKGVSVPMLILQIITLFAILANLLIIYLRIF